MQEDSITWTNTRARTHTHTHEHTNTHTHTHTQVQTVARVQEQLHASQREHTASLNSLQKLFSETVCADRALLLHFNEGERERERERVAENREAAGLKEKPPDDAENVKPFQVVAQVAADAWRERESEREWASEPRRERASEPWKEREREREAREDPRKQAPKYDPRGGHRKGGQQHGCKEQRPRHHVGYQVTLSTPHPQSAGQAPIPSKVAGAATTGKADRTPVTPRTSSADWSRTIFDRTVSPPGSPGRQPVASKNAGTHGTSTSFRYSNRDRVSADPLGIFLFPSGKNL